MCRLYLVAQRGTYRQQADKVFIPVCWHQKAGGAVYHRIPVTAPIRGNHRQSTRGCFQNGDAECLLNIVHRRYEDVSGGIKKRLQFKREISLEQNGSLQV